MKCSCFHGYSDPFFWPVVSRVWGRCGSKWVQLCVSWTWLGMGGKRTWLDVFSDSHLPGMVSSGDVRTLSLNVSLDLIFSTHPYVEVLMHSLTGCWWALCSCNMASGEQGLRWVQLVFGLICERNLIWDGLEAYMLWWLFRPFLSACGEQGLRQVWIKLGPIMCKLNLIRDGW